MGLAILTLQRFPSRGNDLVIMLILSAMWALNGIAYGLMHFSAINPAARFFAVLFIVEAARTPSPDVVRKWPRHAQAPLVRSLHLVALDGGDVIHPVFGGAAPELLLWHEFTDLAQRAGAETEEAGLSACRSR